MDLSDFSSCVIDAQDESPDYFQNVWRTEQDKSVCIARISLCGGTSVRPGGPKAVCYSEVMVTPCIFQGQGFLHQT